MKIAKFKVTQVGPLSNIKVGATLLFLNPEINTYHSKATYLPRAFATVTRDGTILELDHFNLYTIKNEKFDCVFHKNISIGIDHCETSIYASLMCVVDDPETTKMYIESSVMLLERKSLTGNVISYFSSDLLLDGDYFSNFNCSTDVNNLLSHPKIISHWNDYVTNGVKTLFKNFDFFSMKRRGEYAMECKNQKELIQLILVDLSHCFFAASQRFPKLWKLYGAMAGMPKEYLDITYMCHSNIFACGKGNDIVLSGTPHYHLFKTKLI